MSIDRGNGSFILNGETENQQQFLLQLFSFQFCNGFLMI